MEMGEWGDGEQVLLWSQIIKGNELGGEEVVASKAVLEIEIIDSFTVVLMLAPLL